MSNGNQKMKYPKHEIEETKESKTLTIIALIYGIMIGIFIGHYINFYGIMTTFFVQYGLYVIFVLLGAFYSVIAYLAIKLRIRHKRRIERN